MGQILVPTGGYTARVGWTREGGQKGPWDTRLAWHNDAKGMTEVGRIGSRLWIKKRSKVTNNLLLREGF